MKNLCISAYKIKIIDISILIVNFNYLLNGKLKYLINIILKVINILLILLIILIIK